VAPALDTPGAAFVTLRIDGALRGCVGTYEPREPLYRTVQKMALAAATRDPRFQPLTAGELPRTAIEISVLSRLALVRSEADVQVGRHGVHLRVGTAAALLLPQVAVERRWDAVTFLGAVAQKAGLAADAWRQPDAELRVFEAQVFDEHDVPRG
jgi:AmmeMemoRadiSam system protein A